MDKAKLQAVLDGLPKEGAVGAPAEFTLPIWVLPLVKKLLEMLLSLLS